MNKVKISRFLRLVLTLFMYGKIYFRKKKKILEKSVDKQKKLSYNKNRPTKMGQQKYIEK